MKLLLWSVYDAMLSLYTQYNAGVNIDVHSKAVGILQSLDTNKDFVMSEAERANAVVNIDVHSKRLQ